MMAMPRDRKGGRGQENEGCAGCCQGWGAASGKAAPPRGNLVVILVVIVAVAAHDIDETEHPVVHRMRPVHADDEIAAGLEELVGHQLAIRDKYIAGRILLTDGNR